MALGRHRSVGIRLTDRGASFVELESVLGHVRMREAGALDLDAVGASDDGAALSAVEKNGSVGRGRLFAKADQVILGIPRREVICRFIDVPNVGEDQLAGLLAFEIERHVPFPVEEACYSYQKVSSSGATVQVLILAAKRTSIEETLARAERLGIIPTGVDVTSMAATTALLYQRGIPAGQTVTLVQVEDAEATVEVLSRHAMLSSRIVALGGLAAELKRVATVIDGSAGPILLQGGDDSLVQSLREELGTSIDRWDPTPLAADPTAFGLALRGFPRYALSGNLLPPERRLVRNDPAMTLCWSLLALVGCLSGVWWASDALLEQRVLERLTEDIRQVRQEASAVTALQQEASALNRRLKTLEGLASAQGRSIQLLREVVLLLPPDVLLQELSFDGTKVRLRGSTTASAALLISAFERSVYLENAAFTAPISVQGKDRQAFEIAATMRAVPRPPAEQPEGGAS